MRIMYQSVFKRYEMKYLLDQSQFDAVMSAMDGKMNIDKYGRSTIRNVYFDTDSFLLARRSIEKPIYKEKLRARSYGDGKVYVEIKKKYDSIVYKRRVGLPEADAYSWLYDHHEMECPTQIEKEISTFIDSYKTIGPKMYIGYEREAYNPCNGSDFRVTFDRNIGYRMEDVNLGITGGCKPILPDGLTLMELKTSGGLPIWMTKCISRCKAYKSSFSKYGSAYKLAYRCGEIPCISPF